MSNLAHISDHERFQAQEIPPPDRKGAQLEDGYTRTANKLVEAFAKAPLTSREARIIRAVERATYGWNKPSAWLAQDVLAKMTELSPKRCSEALNSLIRKRVLIREGGSRSPVKINKHVDEWNFSSQKSRVTPKSAQEPKWGHCPQDGVTERPQDGDTNKDRKDSTTANAVVNVQLHLAAFEIFYNAGLPKKNRKKAESAFKTQAKKHGDPQSFAEMLAENIKSRLGTGELGFDAMHPTTYLNQQRWEDELPERCPHAAILSAWNEEMPAHIEKVSPDDWTPEHKGFQALAVAWENFKTKPRVTTGKPVFTDEQSGIEFYREVFRRLAQVGRVQLEESAHWCRLSWAVRQAETIRIFKGEVA